MQGGGAPGGGGAAAGSRDQGKGRGRRRAGRPGSAAHVGGRRGQRAGIIRGRSGIVIGGHRRAARPKVRIAARQMDAGTRAGAGHDGAHDRQLDHEGMAAGDVVAAIIRLAHQRADLFGGTDDRPCPAMRTRDERRTLLLHWAPPGIPGTVPGRLKLRTQRFSAARTPCA